MKICSLLSVLALFQSLLPTCAQNGRIFKQTLQEASKLPIKLYPSHDMPMIQAWNGSVSHNPLSKNVIFSFNFPDHIFGMYNIASFLGSARKFHDGDIVLGLPNTVPLSFLEDIAHYDVVIYLLPMIFFEGHQKEHMFHFDTLPPITAMPVAQVRYMLYQYWALKYQRKASILVSDFRDVFFQSDPFVYAEDIWNRRARLALSLEFHPNKVIGTCPFNAGWIKSCYGADALDAVRHHLVSCSGVSMGARNSILVYSYLQMQHLNPEVRKKSVQTHLQSRGFPLKGSDAPQLSNNDKCHAHGMDQGIHNWLLRSGELRRVFGAEPTLFHQGEGPINNIGSFMGARAKVRLNMEEIGLFKLNDHSAYTVHNWNGDLSPVVHQYDRHDQYKGKFDQEMTPLVGSRRYYEKQGLPFPFQK